MAPSLQNPNASRKQIMTSSNKISLVNLIFAKTLWFLGESFEKICVIWNNWKNFIEASSLRVIELQKLSQYLFANLSIVFSLPLVTDLVSVSPFLRPDVPYHQMHFLPELSWVSFILLYDPCYSLSWSAPLSDTSAEPESMPESRLSSG